MALKSTAYFLDFSFFGDGLLTYYNPINKEWLFNAGFNTYLTILVDIGIAGILWVATFLTLFIYTATKKMPALGGYWAICLIVYLFVGFIFSECFTFSLPKFGATKGTIRNVDNR